MQGVLGRGRAPRQRMLKLLPRVKGRVTSQHTVFLEKSKWFIMG